ncbi:dTDP-glucose 4,6-dehydratase [Chromatiales bacterium (ex Bugula neritina AB1)]|nr:dTDP-glucose 4,6-dehydratase [Chromatiales bacterium (ex Bugula neritina AB1)]
MSRLLVTGGAGFIGANFVHYWLRQYPEDYVVVVDALTYAGNLASLASLAGNSRYTFVKGDINDQSLIEKLLRENSLDTIVNFAAESHVDRSISGPDVFINTNIIGTHSLLKAARQIWLDEKTVTQHRFHHVSTDEVYGALGPSDPAFSEKHQYAPNSPYSASKAASDHLVRAYLHTFGLQVTTSNCSNNYGPYHFPEKLIPLIITNILNGDELPVYGDGLQIRDWLYVDDHARGIEKVITHGKVGETYNIGGNNEITNIDIVNRLCAEVDKRLSASEELRARYPFAPVVGGKDSRSLIRYVDDRRGHDRRYAIDPEKANSELGYEPHETFETGISKTLDWFLNNPQWWEPLRAPLKLAA